MSEYGPAFFIKKKDKSELKKEEQEKLLNQVIEIAKNLKLKDSNGDIVDPEFYDYDSYEEKSVSFLLFSSFEWGIMPEEIQKEQEEADIAEILKIGKELDKMFPDTYEYECYYVES